ncbi:hypothetical protein [Rosettibacter firmus]|uniref:hypothetical protein n=1 Tax=Rosettibacter firmus TaxID=3111522 RepID=UPI00336BAEE2
MRKVIFYIFFSCAVINAQVNIDSLLTKTSGNLALKSTDTITGDSINVKSIVEQQILAAKLKMEQEKLEKNNINNSYEVNVSNVPAFKPKKTLVQLFLNLSFEVKLLLIFSFFLFLLIAIRRIILKVQKKAKQGLKNKIKLLREEKVISKVEDKKSKSRRTLIHDLPLNRLTEKNITKKAKELKISKGELMLAARLKYLEYERM